MAKLADEVLQAGGFVTLDNPQGSLLFETPEIKRLSITWNLSQVDLDLRAYGHAFPGALCGVMAVKKKKKNKQI